MNNGFIRDDFYWGRQGTPRFRWANGLLRRLHVPVRVTAPLDPQRDMTTLEARINFFHLVEQVCLFDVPGDLIECGVFTGETATLIGRVMERHAPTKMLHLYDHFGASFQLGRAVRPVLEENLRGRELTRWEIHEGRFQRTMPRELPATVCFAHVDCGGAADPAAHEATLTFLLEQIYPRLAPKGVLVLMDYCDPTRLASFDPHPAVRRAADAFFADKPEQVEVLVAGDISLGYIRKR